MSRQTIKFFLLLVVVSFSVEPAYSSSYRVPKKPASVAVADIDNDGDLDIVVACDSDTLVVMINNGYSLFTYNQFVYCPYFGKNIGMGFVNSDPLPDIVTQYANYPNTYITSFVNNQSWFIQDSIYLVTDDIDYLELSDIDGINNTDIIIGSHLGKFWGILYNNGEGKLSTPKYYSLSFHPSGLAVGKINNDDRNDIAVSGNAKVIKLYLNKPSGLDTITIDTSPLILSPISIEDLNNDNKNEIIGVDGGMPGTRKRLMIYSQDTSGTFELSYSKWIDEAMSRIFIADLNQDSFNDIIYNATLYYPNSNYEVFHTYILFNNKDGTFQDPVNYYTGICSHVSYAADLDGNGWKDIITLNYDFYNPPPDTCSIHILFNDGTGVFQEDPVTDVKEEKPIPAEFELYQNYPNPFNPSTAISYKLPFESDISITIFDLTGRVVRSIEISNQTAGFRTELWDGRNEYGEAVTSGVYIYTLKAISLEGNGRTFVKSSKCMLLK